MPSRMAKPTSPIRGAGARPPALIPAAAYLRMSTEHQRYSADNQLEVINLYAAERGYDLVFTYTDLGRSGITLERRPGLQHLLRDVQSGTAAYRALLVYDVSRWGRFQDPDEAATHELACRRAGVAVHYCAEQFENDGSIGSSVIKALKRAMAGEYSRELSVKTFAGQANLVRKGFWVGGRPGLGFQRHLLDEDGNAKCVLQPGQAKWITTDRVVIVPGPAAEIRLVRRIFRLYVEARLSETKIAEMLDEERALGSRWYRQRIRKILSNERFVGNHVWARTTLKLASNRRITPPEAWIRRDGAHKPIVSIGLFKRAQAFLAAGGPHISDDEILAEIRALLKREGRLDGSLISANCTANKDQLKYRFGGLREVYALVGYTVGSDYAYIDDYRQLRPLQDRWRDEVTALIRSCGVPCRLDEKTGVHHCDDGRRVLFTVLRPRRIPPDLPRWLFRPATHAAADLHVLACMEPGSLEERHFYVIPTCQINRPLIRLGGKRAARFEGNRSDTLAPMLATIAAGG